MRLGRGESREVEISAWFRNNINSGEGNRVPTWIARGCSLQRGSLLSQILLV